MDTYDHLGNHVRKYLLPDILPYTNKNRMVFNIKTINNWIMNKVHTNKDEVIWRASDTEM